MRSRLPEPVAAQRAPAVAATRLSGPLAKRSVPTAVTVNASMALARVEELVKFARRHGCRREDLIDMILGVPG